MQTKYQCSCGKQEDTYHFFLVCKNYSIARNTLFDCLFMLELVNIDLNLLLYGDVNLPLHINNKIFAAVHKFIDESCRFSSLVFYNCFQMFSIVSFFYNLHDILLYIRRGTSKLSELVSDPFE